MRRLHVCDVSLEKLERESTWSEKSGDGQEHLAVCQAAHACTLAFMHGQDYGGSPVLLTSFQDIVANLC